MMELKWCDNPYMNGFYVWDDIIGKYYTVSEVQRRWYVNVLDNWSYERYDTSYKLSFQSLHEAKQFVINRIEMFRKLNEGVTNESKDTREL